MTERLLQLGLAKVKSMHWVGVRTMRLGIHQECVGSSPRVSGARQDGIREFTRRRPRLAVRLSGVAEKLIGKLVNIRFKLEFESGGNRFYGVFDG
ncbi:hypothetical protein GW17_00048570 [Ensete ventricosum]|nr:hypothetical protein GW17_00048570 [Ensete ventricosum]